MYVSFYVKIHNFNIAIKQTEEEELLFLKEQVAKLTLEKKRLLEVLDKKMVRYLLF